MRTRLAVPVGPSDHVQGLKTPHHAARVRRLRVSLLGMAHAIVKAIQEQLAEQLRFVFRHFPLTQIHRTRSQRRDRERGRDARQVRPMHDVLYHNQKALADETW